MDESTMDQVVVFIVVLLLAIVTFASYRLYRKIRLARSGPPKSLTIQRSPTTSDKSKKETKEAKVIGMINCEYCGSLMPQTALTCPNCGASRRR
jgi:hypothetical protein